MANTHYDEHDNWPLDRVEATTDWFDHVFDPSLQEARDSITEDRYRDEEFHKTPREVVND